MTAKSRSGVIARDRKPPWENHVEPDGSSLSPICHGPATLAQQARAIIADRLGLPLQVLTGSNRHEPVKASVYLQQKASTNRRNL